MNSTAPPRHRLLNDYADTDFEPGILYVDDFILVADKPAGLLSIPAAGADRRDSLASRIQARHPRAQIAHRLDEATSGIVLFSMYHAMLQRIHWAFRQRVVGKRYQAVVHGHVAQDDGVIDLPLAPVPDRNPWHQVDHANGLRAVTRFVVMERFERDGEPVTRVDLKPITGRTHQLRVHLLALGHPIIGDPLYAPEGSARRHKRLHLHASQLSLCHPRHRTPRCFDSPVPF